MIQVSIQNFKHLGGRSDIYIILFEVVDVA
jgi:hypothetical protein